ncbi:MAG TPA: nuclear transport factor 2 family protein [Pyrinomonadaceae bacterium]|nr:nuclear transport factor 2 family protein [Pyrinomonadaceae bacterium]
MMRELTILVVVLVAGACLAKDSNDAVIAEVLARDAEIAAAHGRGDMAAYRAGLSKEYVYIDISGKRVTLDILEQRREEDKRRIVSSESSEDEAIRIADDVVLLRGLESSVASYYGGLPRISRSRWTALWVREADGVWRLRADTATIVRDEALPFVHVPQSEAALRALTGRWALSLDPPMELVLVHESDKLIGTITGQEVKFTFRPASAVHFIAAERPFELRFAPDGRSLQFVTWGTPTTATRVVEK